MTILPNDTICALATPAGGALGIIRVSGPEAISIVDCLFRGKRPLADAKAATAHYGHLIDDEGQTIDEVVATVYRAPHSYTGEHAVELSCHGSAYVLQQATHALIKAGCRQANPGEYTQRAYLNGKMDLSQAEAVADLIAATNKASHRAALSQLRGHFSSELSAMREELLRLTALLELELDFSDHEELEFANREELEALSRKIADHLASLADSFHTGRAIKQGIPVAIVGKTNVGKSTLLNRLLHDERAIVSPIHGTTRDSIEDTTQIQGITFRFIDTAGIRSTTDTIEQIGIDRTFQKIGEASIVLWLVDATPSPQETIDMLSKCGGKQVIVVRNKIDLQSPTASSEPEILPELSNAQQHAANQQPTTVSQISISAKDNIHIDQLETLLRQAASIPEITENDIIITSARHYELLLRAHEAMTRVLEGLYSQLPSDLIAEDLRQVLSFLAGITGQEITTNDTLTHIFEHFCVGK